jgi:hypothetical protein
VTQLVWAETGKRFYETGIDRGVLYVDSDPGVAWSGLISLDETPSGGEAQAYYIDGIKYLNVAAPEEYEATLIAFYSPEEFDVCDGVAPVRPGMRVAQQSRKPFCLTYRTRIGNDLAGADYGYKIHLIYNALVKPAQHTYNTNNSNDPSVPTLSWGITTKPVEIAEATRSSHIIIDSTTTPITVVAALEAILYGTDIGIPRFPTPAEMYLLFDDTTDFVVTDLTGGEFSISGSLTAVIDLGGGEWKITSDTVVVVDDDHYSISST